MHVGIHQAREAEQTASIVNLCLICRDLRCETDELALPDADVESLDRCPVGPDDAHAFEDQVIWHVVGHSGPS